MEEEDIDMETVHDSQAFIHHHLNLLERPSTPGEHSYTHRIIIASEKGIQIQIIW